LARKARNWLKPRSVPPIVRQVRTEALTYLDETALVDLYELATHLDKISEPGIYMEAGCALGGSAIVIAAAKKTDRVLRVYDAFGMIPEPGENDGEDVHQRYAVIAGGKAEGIAGNLYYGYESDLQNRVVDNFQKFDIDLTSNHVELVKGLFQDTLKVSESVALLHVDGDWYDSVTICLARVVPHLSPRGVIVVDDYDSWSGARRAVDEFFAERRGEFVFERKSRLNIRRR